MALSVMINYLKIFWLLKFNKTLMECLLNLSFLEGYRIGVEDEGICAEWNKIFINFICKYAK